MFDVTIIGAGIAGASLAADLARDYQVLLLEREEQPGYHSTGRSAAIYSETYGNDIIRKLTSLGRSFFENPPQGFSDVPLWRDRQVLLIGREDQRDSLDRHYVQTGELTGNLKLLSAEEVVAAVPIIDASYVAGGVLEPDAKELDVHAIHSGFLRQFKKLGGQLITDADVTGLSRKGPVWNIETTADTYESNIIVNAAGAWVDTIAQLAKLQPIGATPLRRTALTVPLDRDNAADWPMVIDIDEKFYFKPESGSLLCSPADETEMAPCDVQPDELDIAITVDLVETATELKIRKILRSWAGLRTFAPDRTTVVGFDQSSEGFFWLAGQGGYGIQTCPAMASAAAGLIREGALPSTHLAAGLTEASLSPNRFRQAE